MRIPQFFKRLTKSAPSTPAPPVSDSAEPGNARDPELSFTRRQTAPDRLSVQAAIIQHLEWCVLFNEHLSLEDHPNPDNPPQPLPSAADSGLGVWIEEVRQTYPLPPPRFEALAQAHEQLHLIAQEARQLAHEGRMDLASTLLNTDFERSRAQVLELLRSMQKG